MENSLLNAKKKSFGLYEAALATILFIVFNVAFVWLYTSVPVNIRANKAVYYLASFILEALFAVTSFVVAVTRKTDFIEANGLKKKINFNIVFYCILISFVCLIFFGNLTNVFIEFLYLCGYSSVLGNIEINNFGVYLIYIIISCVTPAVCEEILFRGTIASGLKEKGFKIALFGSAIIFTLMHGNPEQTVHQFIIGLVVGYIFLKTGNIWLGIIIHFMNNFISVTQVYILSLYPTEQVVQEVVATTPANPWVSLFMSLVWALVFAFVGYIIVKKLIRIVNAESDRINGVAETQMNENATIKVDDAEVAVEMTVDGKIVETKEETLSADGEAGLQKTASEPTKVSVIVMFVLSGAYFLIDWLTSLLTGLGF